MAAFSGKRAISKLSEVQMQMLLIAKEAALFYALSYAGQEMVLDIVEVLIKTADVKI